MNKHVEQIRPEIKRLKKDSHPSHMDMWDVCEHLLLFIDSLPEEGWISVKDALPPIDEEVIVLSDNMHGLKVKNANRISFGHIVNPNGYDGKDILTGKVTHYEAMSYDGWNIPDVHHWIPCPPIDV